MEVVFFHSFYLWISIRIFSFTTLEQVMGPQNKKLNEINYFIFSLKEIITEKSMVYKCAWYCWVVCVFENSPGWNSSVSSLRGFHQFVMSSLRSIPILLRFALDREHGFSPRSNCKLGRTFTTQRFCAGTTFTPWIFFFHSLFLRNKFTKIPYHLFL